MSINNLVEATNYFLEEDDVTDTSYDPTVEPTKEQSLERGNSIADALLPKIKSILEDVVPKRSMGGLPYGKYPIVANGYDFILISHPHVAEDFLLKAPDRQTIKAAPNTEDSNKAEWIVTFDVLNPGNSYINYPERSDRVNDRLREGLESMGCTDVIYSDEDYGVTFRCKKVKRR
jgi:hypothetical protein